MLTRAKKAQRITQLSEQLSRARAVFLVDFKGMDVEQVTILRKKLRKTDSEMIVVRNTLAKLAIKDHPEIQTILETEFMGTNAFIFAYEDPSASVRTLSQFSKEIGVLKVKMGAMEGQKLDKNRIQYLATLPSKESLQSQLLAMLLMPATHLVRAMNGVPAGLLNALNAYKDSKDQ